MARIDTLTNFLTDIANAIRNKKGTTETINASVFDTEIENITSGGLNELKCTYVDNQQSFRVSLSGVGDDEIKINMSASTQDIIPLGCLYDSDFQKFTFKNIKSLSTDFRKSNNKSVRNNKCKIINFNFEDDTKSIYQITRSENSMLFSAIEELNGIVWDLSQFSNQDMRYNHFWNQSPNLKEIRLKRDSWNGGSGGSQPHLKLQTSNSFSDDSIYSIAFCLADRSAEETVYRIYLHNDVKIKLNNLYCYYNELTEQYEKCDITQTGAITLTNYITNIVNWTIS